MIECGDAKRGSEKKLMRLQEEEDYDDHWDRERGDPGSGIRGR